MRSDRLGPQGELPPVHEAWLPREHSLHRPRHGRRQLTALGAALVFFVTPTIMWVAGMRPAEIENHKLASLPTPADGWGFFTGMDGWATDNLVFRAGAVQATDWVSRTFFGEPAPFDQGGGAPSGPLGGTPTGDGTEQGNGKDDTSDQAGRRVIEGSDGWLYFREDTLSKCEPSEPLDSTVAALAELRRVVEDSGRKFVFVPVPDKTTMVPEHLPDSYPGKDCAKAVTPDLWRKLLRVAGGVDIRPRLQQEAERINRPVYYPMDTHWTHEGALQMVNAIAEEVSPGITDRWKWQPQETYSAPADLPPLIGQKGDNEATLYQFRPDGRTNTTSDRDDDVKQLSKPVHRTTDPIRGMVTKPTAVFGDSFLLTSAYYLPGAFSDVTMQYYHAAPDATDQMVRTMVDSDVVVLQIVERNIAAGGPQVLTQEFLTKAGAELAKHPIN